jgi:hypothetical protein
MKIRRLRAGDRAGHRARGPGARKGREQAERAIALGASVAWLGAGAAFGLEGFGIPSFVEWRPVFFMLFLAVNAFAAGVVVSEAIVAAQPRLARRRALLMQAIAGALLLVSLLVYLDFMQTHAVTARAY